MVTDRAIVVMVRCHNTGRELSTGIEMDASTFSHLPDIRNAPCAAWIISGRRGKPGLATHLLPFRRYHGCSPITGASEMISQGMRGSRRHHSKARCYEADRLASLAVRRYR